MGNINNFRPGEKPLYMSDKFNPPQKITNRSTNVTKNTKRRSEPKFYSNEDLSFSASMHRRMTTPPLRNPHPQIFAYTKKNCN